LTIPPIAILLYFCGIDFTSYHLLNGMSNVFHFPLGDICIDEIPTILVIRRRDLPPENAKHRAAGGAESGSGESGQTVARIS
jgi:hypothetical protein